MKHVDEEIYGPGPTPGSQVLIAAPGETYTDEYLEWALAEAAKLDDHAAAEAAVHAGEAPDHLHEPAAEQLGQPVETVLATTPPVGDAGPPRTPADAKAAGDDTQVPTGLIVEKADGPAEEWPRHKGGGVYELPDGSTVRGADAAAQAMRDAADATVPERGPRDAMSADAERQAASAASGSETHEPNDEHHDEEA